jgi:hypothetical protein
MQREFEGIVAEVSREPLYEFIDNTHYRTFLGFHDAKMTIKGHNIDITLPTKVGEEPHLGSRIKVTIECLD